MRRSGVESKPKPLGFGLGALVLDILCHLIGPPFLDYA